MGAAESWGTNLGGDGRPEHVDGVRVTSDIFPCSAFGPSSAAPSRRTKTSRDERRSSSSAIACGSGGSAVTRPWWAARSRSTACRTSWWA
jgi:hypothetical protein